MALFNTPLTTALLLPNVPIVHVCHNHYNKLVLSILWILVSTVVDVIYHQAVTATNMRTQICTAHHQAVPTNTCMYCMNTVSCIHHQHVPYKHIVHTNHDLLYLWTCYTAYVHSVIIFKQRKYLDATDTHLHQKQLHIAISNLEHTAHLHESNMKMVGINT